MSMILKIYISKPRVDWIAVLPDTEDYQVHSLSPVYQYASHPPCVCHVAGTEHTMASLCSLGYKL